MAVSILLVRALVEAVETAGIDRHRFLKTADVDPRLVAETLARVDLDVYDALHRVAIDLTGDDALGLHMGELASAQTHSLAAHLVVHAPTMRDGVDALFRFHQLISDRKAWSLVEEGALARLDYDEGDGDARFRRFRSEISMVGFFRMVKFFSRDARVHAVNFQHPAPPYESEYARIFGEAVQFGAPSVGVVFDRVALDAPQLHQDPEFYAALSEEAERRVLRIGRTVSYAERVRDCLVRGGQAGVRDMEQVARSLGMSTRSLRRRLSEEGASYADIVDDAQAILAKRLLADGARSISEAAYAMGFSGPSAFHRAFKRWTGTTPTEFRRARVH